MWVEKTENGKVIYRERYKNPYTGKWASPVSITFEKETKKNREQAEVILREKIAQKTNNVLDQSKTFSETYALWLTYYKTRTKRNTQLRQVSIKKQIDKYIDPDTLMSRIDKRMIDNLVDKMYNFGNLSYDYTSKVLTTLHQIFEFSIDRGFMKNNPITRYRISIKPKDKEKQKNRRKLKYLEKEEVEQILAYFKNNESVYWLHRRITEFLYLTGMRFGEMAALQWKNFNGNSVNVNGTLDYSQRKREDFQKADSTKTAAGDRIVDLPTRVLEIFDELRTSQNIRFGKTEADDFIFRDKTGYPVSVFTINKALKSAAVHCNINKTVTSHIFRHTHVSMLAEMNIPLKTIMDRIGHSDASTTLRIYNHVTNKAKQNVLDALNSLK